MFNHFPHAKCGAFQRWRDSPLCCRPLLWVRLTAQIYVFYIKMWPRAALTVCVCWMRGSGKKKKDWWNHGSKNGTPSVWCHQVTMTTGCAPSVFDSCSHGALAWLRPWTPIGRIDSSSGVRGHVYDVAVVAVSCCFSIRVAYGSV